MSGTVPGPRVVAADEVVAGWPDWAREGLALWIASGYPDLIDEYDAVVRRAEAAMASRAGARSGVKSGLTPL